MREDSYGGTHSLRLPSVAEERRSDGNVAVGAARAHPSRAAAFSTAAWEVGLWHHALDGLVAQDDGLENTRTIATTPGLHALLRPEQSLGHGQDLLVRRRAPDRAARVDPLGLSVGKRHLRAADVQRHVRAGGDQVLVVARAELVGRGAEVADPSRLGRVLLSTRSLLGSSEEIPATVVWLTLLPPKMHVLPLHSSPQPEV